jgi:hypothetical protein
MNDENRKDGSEKLELKVRRVRTRIASNVKTGTYYSGPLCYTLAGSAFCCGPVSFCRFSSGGIQ